MAKYDRGCTEYISRDYVMTIHFPKDRVVCDLCPLCHTENSGTRFRCLETAEILPFHNVDYGLNCPLFKDNPLQNDTTNKEEQNDD